jgi:methylated-DNA-[protein]-cysteine S-methyltransferase
MITAKKDPAMTTGAQTRPAEEPPVTSPILVVTDRAHIVVPSPIGSLTLVAEHGKLTGLYMDTHGRQPGRDVLGSAGDVADEPFASAVRQLDEYFAGRLTAFDLPLEPAGTQFQRRVWSALQTIPYGQTWSYGQLARAIGKASASRAVGLANGRNPIAVVIPCHRVIGSDGSLTGYGGGLDRKRYLLGLEEGTTPAHTSRR